MADLALRSELESRLASLQTEWQMRAYTSEEVNAVIARLQGLAPDDYEGKLRIAGFTLSPYCGGADDISQACETCMYYIVHRQFCDLPELRIPVKPQWSCRLWRI